MKYKDFLSSLNKNKIHFVSKSTTIKEDIDCKEPYYCVSSSGTESEKKHYLISLSKLEAGAKSLIKHYDFSSSDRWLQSISTNHIGGFSINARSYYASMKEPLFFKWKPEDLEDCLNSNDITIMSLVPTQVFDLVSFGIKAPKSIKYVFVGGAKLNNDLYDKAIKLGWPLKLCFGMTETGAQMAYSKDSQHYTPYSDWKVSVSKNSNLLVKGPSLYTHQYINGEWVENNSEWYESSDSIELSEKGFVFKGRTDFLIKEKGVFKDYESIRGKFIDVLLRNNLSKKDYELVALNDQRGAAFTAIISQNYDFELSKIFNEIDVKGIYFVDEIPRTELYKLNKEKLKGVLARQILFY